LQLLRILRIDRQRGAFGAFYRVFKKHRKVSKSQTDSTRFACKSAMISNFNCFYF